MSDTSKARITIDVEWPTQSTPELEEDVTVRSMEHFEDALCRLAPDFGGHVTKVYGEWLDDDPLSDPLSFVHKAAPAPIPVHLSDVAEWVCETCGGDIKRVPGGRGSTWVHSVTGAVVHMGGPR